MIVQVVRLNKSQLSFLLLTCLAFAGSVSADEKQIIPQEILMRSNDYSEVLDEYWPRISTGDANAMAVVFEALYDCWNFRDAISQAADINEFDELLRDKEPEFQIYGRARYYKCQSVVGRFDEYPGWQKMRERAALGGHKQSRLFLVNDYYRFRAQKPDRPRPFSPAGFVLEALAERYPPVFLLFAHGEAPRGIRKDSSPITSAAWTLVYCHYSDYDCESPESLEVVCLHQTDQCARFENILGVVQERAGGEAQFREAQEMSRELITLVELGAYEQLGLDLVW